MWLNCLVLLKGWNEVIKRNGRKVWISAQNPGALITDENQNYSICGCKATVTLPVNCFKKRNNAMNHQVPSMTGRRVSNLPAGLGTTRLF